MRGKGVSMRTITIEEHFLAKGFREAMQSHASSLGGRLHSLMTAERLTKLADLGSTRLKDMDRGGIDLQVISNITSVLATRPLEEGVQRGREANGEITK